MAFTLNGELILDHDESAAFIANMTHPNTDALRRRDEFLRDLEDANVIFANGEIVADFPDICLPTDDYPFYDEKPSRGLVSTSNMICFEQGTEIAAFSPTLYGEHQKKQTIDKEREEWIAPGIVSQSIMLTAA